MLMAAFTQAQWIGGTDVVVDPATSTTISTAQPTIKTLKVNGNLTFATGGSVTVTNWIWVGDWYGVRFHIAAESKDGGVWFYQPDNFEGDYTQWFAEHM
jgi:hypothetical protein